MPRTQAGASVGIVIRKGRDSCFWLLRADGRLRQMRRHGPMSWRFGVACAPYASHGSWGWRPPCLHVNVPGARCFAGELPLRLAGLRPCGPALGNGSAPSQGAIVGGDRRHHDSSGHILELQTHRSRDGAPPDLQARTQLHRSPVSGLRLCSWQHLPGARSSLRTSSPKRALAYRHQGTFLYPSCRAWLSETWLFGLVDDFSRFLIGLRIQNDAQAADRTPKTDPPSMRVPAF